jgi:uronate dehydrogenase
MTPSRILLTGAAGKLGQLLREALAPDAEILRVSDIAPLGPPAPREEVVVCDLADAAAVYGMCQGVDAIMHFGGIAGETEWPELLHANIIGVANIYEGARRAGVDRVIFASSNHATGLYPTDERLSHLTPPRPDSLYGLTKAFGEDVAAHYAYKHGIRSFCLRIGSCAPKPRNRRALSTWLSYPDLLRLINVGLGADYIFEIVYGVSNNTRSWWDISAARRLGYEPQDNAEAYAAEVERIEPDDELARDYQGGSHAAARFKGWKESFSRT